MSNLLMNSLLVYLGPAFFLFNEMLFTDKKKKKRREFEVADWKSNYRNGRIYFFITFDDLWILFELCQCNQNDIRLFVLEATSCLLSNVMGYQC